MKNNFPPVLESVSFRCVLYSAWSRTMSLYRKFPPEARNELIKSRKKFLFLIDFSILTNRAVLLNTFKIGYKIPVTAF